MRKYLFILCLIVAYLFVLGTLFYSSPLISLPLLLIIILFTPRFGPFIEQKFPYISIVREYKKVTIATFLVLAIVALSSFDPAGPSAYQRYVGDYWGAFLFVYWIIGARAIALVRRDSDMLEGRRAQAFLGALGITVLMAVLIGPVSREANSMQDVFANIFEIFVLLPIGAVVLYVAAKILLAIFSGASRGTVGESDTGSSGGFLDRAQRKTGRAGPKAPGSSGGFLEQAQKKTGRPGPRR